MLINESLLTLSSALKTRRGHRETLKPCSGFMMPQARGEGKTQVALLAAEGSHVQSSLWCEELKSLLYFSRLTCSDSLSIHQETWGNFSPSVLTGRSGGQSASLGEVWSEVCHSSHHHLTPSAAAVSQLHRPDLWTMRKGLSGQAEMKVIPHSCHNLVGEGMRPFTDIAQSSSCQGQMVLGNFKASFRCH